MPRSKPSLQRALQENLKRERLSRGLTQEDLSAKCGYSIAYISLLERGGRNAPLGTVETIADALGMEPVELLRKVA